MLVNFCPNCGQKAEQLFNFCPQCGVKLPKEETVPIAESTTAVWSTTLVGQGPEEEPAGRSACTPQKQASSTPIKDVFASPETQIINKTVVGDPPLEDCQAPVRGRSKRNVPLRSPPESTISTARSPNQAPSSPKKVIIPSPAIPPLTKHVAESSQQEDCQTTGRGRGKRKAPGSSPPKSTILTTCSPPQSPKKVIIPSPAIPPLTKPVAESSQQEDCQTTGRGRSKRKAPGSSPPKSTLSTVRLPENKTSSIHIQEVVPSPPGAPQIIKIVVECAQPEDCQTAGRGRAKRKAPESSPTKETTPIKHELSSSASHLANRSIVKSTDSPQKKRRKSISIEQLPENQLLTDNSNKKWKLGRLLAHGPDGFLYAAEAASGSHAGNQRWSLKLDAKNGRIYNEHNFLQRAAKKVTVDKWTKTRGMNFLGIPNCVGFGQHEGNYRFLVFPDLGISLQSVLDTCADTLSEKAVFQISYRMLDVFEYIHENEYVHGDLKAEDIFVNPEDLSKVLLANYFSVYRYCPGGTHVASMEGSRKPHEGTVEFISLDIHKGMGPSRRSDLEMMGYCMLKWMCGILPWSKGMTASAVRSQKESYKFDVAGLLKHCFGKRKYPEALKTYLDHVMVLKYEEKPDYDVLRKIFAAPLEKIKASAYDPVDLKV